MVKGVTTSIITLAVLMGSVVACGGTTLVVAPTPEPEPTPEAGPTPSPPDFLENEWTNDDSTALREECEEVASVGFENTNGITSFCINVKDWAESFTERNAEKFCAKEKMIALVDNYRTALVSNGDYQAVWDSGISTIQENCQRKFCTTFVDWKRDEEGGFNARRPAWPKISGNPEPAYPNLITMCEGGEY